MILIDKLAKKLKEKREMAESILVKILNSKPITLSPSCPNVKRRKENPCNNDIIVENLMLMTKKTMKCHRDSLESNNCDEGDDSGTEPWSGSCSSDSLSENSECHIDQNDSGCDEFIFHEFDDEDDQELLEIAEATAKGGNDDNCDVSSRIL